MRSLVFLLILLNLAFLFWVQGMFPWLPWQPAQFVTTPAIESPPTDSDVPTLILLSESKAAELEEEGTNTVEAHMYESESLDIPDMDASSEFPEEMDEEVEPDDDTFDEEDSQLLVENSTIDSEAPDDSVEPEDDAIEEVTEEQLSQEDTLNDTSDASPSLATKVIETFSGLMKHNANDGKDTQISTKEMVIETPYCAELGPYEQLKTVNTVISQLKKSNFLAEKQQKKTQVAKYTQVYLSPFPTRQAANQMLIRLKRLGIQDYAIINKGELANGISLGVYGNQNSVKRRLKELENKGVHHIQTGQRFQNVAKYWINVHTFLKQKPALETLVQSIKPAEFNKIECRK